MLQFQARCADVTVGRDELWLWFCW